MYKCKYLIIAGINKAGTTSLFDYLVSHPDIEGSSIKQTFFFLDKNLQKQLNLFSLYDYEKGFEQFDNFFHKSEAEVKYRIEATPDYLYSPETPGRISAFFEKHPGKVLVILRDPVTRFSSFFYYGKQQGLIPEEMDIETFYEKSKNYTENTNPCLMAYKTGFYSEYLKAYKAIFGDNLIVIFFEDLKNDPQAVMKRICTLLDISSDFYNSYEFKVSNPTVKVKSRLLAFAYGRLRQFYLNHFFKNEAGVALAQFLKKCISPIYRKINYKPLKKHNDFDKFFQIVRADYCFDIKNTEKIIKNDTPWH